MPPDSAWRTGLLRRLGTGLRSDLPLLVLTVLTSLAATAWFVLREPDLHRASAVMLLPTPDAAASADRSDRIRAAMLLLEDPAVLDSVVEREGLRLVDHTGEPLPGWAVVERAELPPDSALDFDLRLEEERFSVVDGGVARSAPYGGSVSVDGMALVVEAPPADRPAALRIVPQDRARARLAEMLDTSPRPGTNAIELSVAARDPDRARRLVNAIALAYERTSARMAHERTIRKRSRIEGSIREQDSLLSQARSMLEQSRDARSPGRSGPEAVRLARRVRALEEVSDRLWRAYESSRVREAVDSGGVEVLRLATASVPVPHRTPLKLLAGGLLGLLLGGGLVTLRAGADGSVSRREELEDDLSLPTLAVIPRIGPPVRRRVPVVGRLVTGGEGSRLWFSRNGTTPVRANGHPEPRRNGAAGRSKNGSRVSIADRMFDSPDSEAYRTLRTNLIFSGAIRSTRSLVVTSPTPGDGKTVTAANLAIALAHQGIKLLLLDADLRAPDLARSFGLPRQPGLTDLLLGEVELATAVRRTETYGLDLLPAGTFVANTSEILSGRRMTRFLEELPERYDLVLIDSPPVLAASDATVLAAVADGVLLVVRAGVTQRTAARHAIERLELVGARVVGSVLNDPDTRLPDSSRYYGSGLHPDSDLHEPLER